MKSLSLIAVLVALLVVPFAVAEDAETAPVAPIGKAAVMAALDKATAAANAEDWDAMIAACQKAIDEAQKIQQGSMNVVFPNAPASWTADEVKAERMAMGAGGQAFNGVHLSRNYKHTESGATVKMLLTDWSMFQAHQRQIIQMKDSLPPQMIDAMGLSFHEKDGYHYTKIAAPDGDQAMLYAFGSKRMLMLECTQRKPEMVDTIFGLIDLKKALGEK